MKPTHGGARKGAGRKPSPERLTRIDARLSKSQIEFLKSIDPNLSKAIRTLIDQARLH